MEVGWGKRSCSLEFGLARALAFGLFFFHQQVLPVWFEVWFIVMFFLHWSKLPLVSKKKRKSQSSWNLIFSKAVSKDEGYE
jgi:hypothetical protein